MVPSIECSIECSMQCSIECSIGCSVECSIERSIERSIDSSDSIECSIRFRPVAPIFLAEDARDYVESSAADTSSPYMYDLFSQRVSPVLPVGPRDRTFAPKVSAWGADNLFSTTFSGACRPVNAEGHVSYGILVMACRPANCRGGYIESGGWHRKGLG